MRRSVPVRLVLMALCGCSLLVAAAGLLYLQPPGGQLVAALGVLLTGAGLAAAWASRPTLTVRALSDALQRAAGRRLSPDPDGAIAQSAQGGRALLDRLAAEIAAREAAEAAARSLRDELAHRMEQHTAPGREAHRELLTRTQEAESISPAKAQFLANMSHEIRTPMNAVLGLTYLLEARPLDAQSLDLVQKTRRAAQGLQSLLNDILDFSEIEAGQLRLQDAPVRLDTVLHNLAQAVGAAAGDKDLALLITPAPQVGGELLGDALRLEQILIHLAGNAIKFTDAGLVRVSVTLQSRDEAQVVLRFAVCDTGIGIEPQQQERVFSAFAQVDGSTSRPFGGTGLGLAICRQLVTCMGGEIGVNSQPGVGSEFWFTMPLRWREAFADAPASLARLEVLVADDHEAGRENLAQTAHAIGWDTTLTDSGLAAIAQLRQRLRAGQSYDVLLLSWKMPGLDGLEVARLMRQALGAQPVPIVLMAHANARGALQRAVDAGLVDGILDKPLTCSSLHDSVAAAMRRRCPPAAVARAAGPGLQRLAGLRVLVVDDSDINREVAQRILKAEGAAVQQAEHGQAALEQLQVCGNAVDLVLMDVQMPGMDGYETTRRLRRLPGLAGLPVVALTADGLQQQDEARNAGMDAFVAKPFDVDELLALILRLTGRPALVGTAPARPAAEQVAASPGIALTEALTIWHDMRVYRQFLVRFVQDHSQGLERLQAQLLAQDLASAAAWLHKLRGSAGNLSLPELAHAAGALEHGLLNAPDAVSPALLRLQAAFAQVCRSMEALAQEPDTAGADRAQASGDLADDGAWADPVELKARLDELLAALDRDNPEAAQPVLRLLGRWVPRARLEVLCRLVDDFDFRSAERLARELAADVAREPA